MKKRAFVFILALSALSLLIWFTGEVLIAIFINNYWVSLIWAILCLVACCTYSVWKCPHAPDDDDDEDEDA